MKVVLLSLAHFRMSDATIMSESQYCESSPVATHHYFWAGSKQAPNFGWRKYAVSFTKVARRGKTAPSYLDVKVLGY